MVTEQTCKLCMTYIQEDESADLDDEILKRLKFLHIDLDHNNEESNFLCSQCDENIENIFDFKSCVVINTEGNTNKQVNSTGERTICHLCKNYGNQQCMISLKKFLKDDGIMEVFQIHLQEVDLQNVYNSMVCEVCQESVANFWSLIESWLRGRNKSDGDTTVDGGDFDSISISAVSDDNMSTKRKKNNLTCSGSRSDNSIKAETDDLLYYRGSVYFSTGTVKEEENQNADVEDMQFKAEEFEIKDEDELFEDHMNNRSELGDKAVAKMFRCCNCSYHTDVENNLNQHVKVNEILNELEYRFEDCSFVTKFKMTLMSQELAHLNSNEKKLYKCKECSYETRYKHHLKRHLLKYKNINEVPVYKCNECSYQTRDKGTLKTHLIKHKSVGEVQVHNCKECAFETRDKGNLGKHLVKHISVDEVSMHKCKECSFETRFKESLKTHLIKHKSQDEVQMYKCKECSFETRFEKSLKSHILKHKSVDEVQMYSCKECSYETRFKGTLRKHLIKHKSVDEAQMYKCKECSFETRIKGTLKRHLLTHKSLDEVQMYNCKECSFETRFKGNMKIHLLKHKSVDEIQMHKCSECSYETRLKGNLRKHLIKHKSVDEVQMYKCKECSFETRYKGSLEIHLLNHKSLDEIQMLSAKM